MNRWWHTHCKQNWNVDDLLAVASRFGFVGGVDAFGMVRRIWIMMRGVGAWHGVCDFCVSTYEKAARWWTYTPSHIDSRPTIQASFKVAQAI